MATDDIIINDQSLFQGAAKSKPKAGTRLDNDPVSDENVQLVELVQESYENDKVKKLGILYLIGLLRRSHKSHKKDVGQWKSFPLSGLCPAETNLNIKRWSVWEWNKYGTSIRKILIDTLYWRDSGKILLLRRIIHGGEPCNARVNTDGSHSYDISPITYEILSITETGNYGRIQDWLIRKIYKDVVKWSSM